MWNIGTAWDEQEETMVTTKQKKILKNPKKSPQSTPLNQNSVTLNFVNMKKLYVLVV